MRKECVRVNIASHPPTVLNNKLQIAHPYDTGTFLDLDTQGGTALFHPRFAGWIHRVD